MRLLFIVDPLSTFKIYKDSTFAMMREAAARGYAIYTCLQSQLTLSGNVVETVATPIALTGNEDDGHDWYRAGDARLLPLTGFDAVLMRKDPPFDMEYVTSTWLLEIAERQGARIFNKPQAIRDHSEKLAIAQFREFTVPTIVSATQSGCATSTPSRAMSSSSRWTGWAARASSAWGRTA